MGLETPKYCVGSQRLRPDTKVQYFGDSKPLRKKYYLSTSVYTTWG